MKSFKLTIVINEEEIKSYDTIKLGIDARRAWYYVTGQFDAAPDF
ncbi:hypothetical protein N8521_02310 [Akkermansiaceae bacterium]|nr:hypothetical protein [Akkermansiaceae bacterium]MDA7532371.1 hypothetical protein [Akkermansiaceae bacterium]MDB4449164.1 hypothetical protein [bacterium]MDB4700523.1 hypothetical protein [Akkermansiaceae bacterium]